MIDWSIDWREWFDIQEPDSAALNRLVAMR